jgi:hypothetical protein
MSSRHLPDSEVENNSNQEKVVASSQRNDPTASQCQNDLSRRDIQNI